MTKRPFERLESPYLDTEARLSTRAPALASGGEPDEGAVADVSPDAGHAEAVRRVDEDGEPENAPSDLATDESGQPPEGVEPDSDVGEWSSETGGHVYEDFEGIDDLEDTADDSPGPGEAFEDEAEPPPEWEEHEETARESAPEAEGVERESDKAPPGQGPSATAPTVTILLDEPIESDDKYRLVSQDGKYSRTLSAKDAKPLVDGARRLSFGGIDPKRSYRLIHVRSAGSSRVVLPTMPFSALTEAGHRAPQATHTYVTVPSQVPAVLPDRFRAERPVDPILVEPSPILVGLTAHDPAL